MMEKYSKFITGLHMFVAGFMFVFMCIDFLEGSFGMAFFIAILFLTNLCAYIHDVRKDENESVH